MSYPGESLDSTIQECIFNLLRNLLHMCHTVKYALKGLFRGLERNEKGLNQNIYIYLYITVYLLTRLLIVVLLLFCVVVFRVYTDWVKCVEDGLCIGVVWVQGFSFLDGDDRLFELLQPGPHEPS